MEEADTKCVASRLRRNTIVKITMSIRARLRDLFPRPQVLLKKRQRSSTVAEPNHEPKRQKTEDAPQTPAKLSAEDMQAADSFVRAVVSSGNQNHESMELEHAPQNTGASPRDLSPRTPDKSPVLPAANPREATPTLASPTAPEHKRSIYSDASTQTEDVVVYHPDEVPICTTCSRIGRGEVSQEPSPCPSCQSLSRESTPSTPPLRTPTDVPEHWALFSSDPAVAAGGTPSPLRDISKFRSPGRYENEQSVFDSDDADELALYDRFRPASGLGAYLDALPGSDDLILSSPDHSPSRPVTRGRKDEPISERLRKSVGSVASAQCTPQSNGTWAPHQLSPIPESHEWLSPPGTPGTPSRTPRRIRDASLPEIRLPSSPLMGSNNTPQRLKPFIAAIQPSIIHSIAVYAGAFVRSYPENLDDKARLESDDFRNALQQKLREGIEDVLRPFPEEDMAGPLRRHFGVFVPGIAEAMIRGMGGS